MEQGAQLKDLWRYNRAAVVRIVRRSKGISRADLARALGLTGAALSKIAAELLKIGVIREYPAPQSTPGRPPVHLQLNPDWAHVVTVNLTHNLAFGVVNLSGELVHYENLFSGPVPGKNYKNIFDRTVPAVVERLTRQWASPRLLGVGVVSSGLVNRNGIICANEELPRRDMDMRKVLAPATDLPVHTDEEFRLLLLGHQWAHDPPNHRNLVVLGAGLIGYGGGQAFAADGRLYYGHNGFAGFPGLQMGAVYRDDVMRPVVQRVREMGGNEVFVERVRQGGAEAVAMYEKCVENYGYRVAQNANYLNPDLILIYSPYSVLGQAFLDKVMAYALRYTDPHNLEGLKVEHGGQRTDKERLVAAALPILARVFGEGELDVSLGEAPRNRRRHGFSAVRASSQSRLILAKR